ncbi:MAG: hypothetical protein HY021_07915 [Burkholderiales bacterium]|nr:hypothetical protein [Burkholderiales bacterium]
MTARDDSLRRMSLGYALFFMIAGLVAGEVFWFWLLRPQWPRGLGEWVIHLALAGLLGAWAGANALLMEWLQSLARLQALGKLLAACVAVSLGVAIFWLAQGGQALILARLTQAQTVVR